MPVQRQILAGVISRATSLVQASAARGGFLSSIGARLGIGRVTSAEEILAGMRDNPIATAMVLLDLGEEGYSLYKELVAQDASLAALESLVHAEPDSPEDAEDVTDIARFQDEFETLRSASAAAGGIERFMTLRRALSMPEGTISLWLTMRAMARSV